MKRSSKTAKIHSHSDYWLDRNLFHLDDDYGWWNKDVENDDDDDDAADERDTLWKAEAQLLKNTRLAAVRRAIANFVNILCGQSVPVEFSSGEQSFTDGKSVVIAADENTKNFDAMVGLALHEGSHVLLTDFGFLQSVSNLTHDPLSWGWKVSFNGNATMEKYYASTSYLYTGTQETFKSIFPQTLLDVLPMNEGSGFDSPLYRAIPYMIGHLHTIMNILEDRRIDKYVYTNAVGYRPYYDSVYNKYFYTSQISKNLKFNPEWREITIENYIQRLLLAFHPDADINAMPGLQSLVDLMDLDNIDRIAPENDPAGKYNDVMVPLWMQKIPSFDECPVLWREACHIYAYILKYASMAENDPTKPDPRYQDIQTKSLSDLPNLDGGPMGQIQETEPETMKNGKEGTYNPEKGEKDVQKAKDLMDGKTKKKKITAKNADAIDAIDKADAKMVNLKGEGIPFGECLVIRKVDKKVMDQNWFIFSGRGWKKAKSEQAIVAGKRMGQILLHRLQVRNDPLLTKQTRLPTGGIDRRLLSQLGMDIESVFQKSRVDIHKPVMLHLTLDASGSMGASGKWERVQTVATALAYVGSKMRNVDVVITIRGGDNIPLVAIIFDSRKDHFVKFTNMFAGIHSAGATPEGLCFKATMNLILECATTHDVYFINFSDGDPAFNLRSGGEWFGYGYDNGTVHTKAMVNQLREHGVKILGYFITHGTKDEYEVDDKRSMYNNYAYENTYLTWGRFKQMYGEDSRWVDVKNATEVLRTLNRLLLTR